MIAFTIISILTISPAYAFDALNFQGAFIEPGSESIAMENKIIPSYSFATSSDFVHDVEVITNNRNTILGTDYNGIVPSGVEIIYADKNRINAQTFANRVLFTPLNVENLYLNRKIIVGMNFNDYSSSSPLYKFIQDLFTKESYVLYSKQYLTILNSAGIGQYLSGSIVPVEDLRGLAEMRIVDTGKVADTQTVIDSVFSSDIGTKLLKVGKNMLGIRLF